MTTERRGSAMRDAPAALTVCDDGQDSFALTRDTVLSAVHDRCPGRLAQRPQPGQKPWPMSPRQGDGIGEGARRRRVSA